MTEIERLTTEDVLQKIGQLKERSRGLTKRNRLERSRKALDDAISLLLALRSRELTPRNEQLVRMELADAHGMKGGVYRREGNDTDALEMYEAGLREEEKDNKSTYNLGNTITLSLTLGRAVLTDESMQDRLRRVVELLEEQTGSGRSDEWWGLSDLAQFYLLLDEEEKAHAAYQRAFRTGPARDERDRHLTLLGELANSVSEAAPDVAALLRKKVAEFDRGPRSSEGD